MTVRCYAVFSSSLPKLQLPPIEETEEMSGREVAELVDGLLFALGCDMEPPEVDPPHGWQGCGSYLGEELMFQVNESFSDDDEWTLTLEPMCKRLQLFKRSQTRLPELLTAFSNALVGEPRVWNVRWFTREEWYRRERWGLEGSPVPVSP